MFENFGFFKSRPETQEQVENILRKIASKQLKKGISKISISLAFKLMKEETDKMCQEKESLKDCVTDNLILNILKEEALVVSDAVDDFMFGGPDRTVQLINEEIDNLRK